METPGTGIQKPVIKMMTMKKIKKRVIKGCPS